MVGGKMLKFVNRKRAARRRLLDDEDGSRDAILMVNAKVSREKDLQVQRIGVAAVGCAIALALATAAWWGICSLGRELFSQNSRYMLQTLEIRSDGKTITPDLVRQWAGLQPGMNLFSVDIRAIRSALLRKVPIVKAVDISRLLPDTLEIRISERLPVARLGNAGFLAVDKDGYVFVLRPSIHTLPVITGCRGSSPYPGSNIKGTVLRALEVLDVCARTPIGHTIRPSVLDISNEDYLSLLLAGGEAVRLSWKESPQPSASRDHIERKLRALIQTLQKSAERGKRIAWVDLTFDDDYIPAQEY
jgi:RecA/RadA recombinase